MDEEYINQIEILLLQASQDSGKTVPEVLALLLDDMLMSDSDHKCHVHWPELRREMDRLHGAVG